MGKKADEALDVSFDDLSTYLRANHSAYMEVEGQLYYLTDANDRYWRAQDTNVLNDKGHYTDASELVPTVREFLDLPFIDDDQSINQAFERATFYASVKTE